MGCYTSELRKGWAANLEKFLYVISKLFLQCLSTLIYRIEELTEVSTEK